MKNSKLLFTVGVIWLMLVSSIGCVNNEPSGYTMNGSGNITTKEMDYSDFTKIEIGHAFDVEISKSDSYSVYITLDDNLFDYLVTDITEDTLYIGLEPNINYRNTTEEATITIPDLDSLNLHGASSADVSGFSSPDSLQVEVSGASRLFFKDVEAGNTQFNISGASKVSGQIKTADCDFLISGASRIELQGSSSDVLINASGASNLSMDDFVIDNASIVLSGASSATIKASGTLIANLSGVSSLEYFGNPTLGTIILSGGSTIYQR